jgi:hypothetical protein
MDDLCPRERAREHELGGNHPRGKRRETENLGAHEHTDRVSRQSWPQFSRMSERTNERMKSGDFQKSKSQPIFCL